ncbi:hypothetical protein QQ045_012244 [Rhodiola kirilowii]
MPAVLCSSSPVGSGFKILNEYLQNQIQLCRKSSSVLYDVKRALSKTTGGNAWQRKCKHHLLEWRAESDGLITALDQSEDQEISRATLIWRAVKLPIYSVALIPLTVGSAVAYFQTGAFSTKRYILLFVSSIFIITWLNLSNDVYDFDTGADKDKKESVVNLVKSRTWTAVAAYSLLFLGFLGLTWASLEAGNIRSILLMTCAIVCGYIYQCPPFRLSYQGLGEPLCFAAFGPFATTAFYLMQSSVREITITRTILAASFFVGFTTTLILFCSHFHQVEGDAAVGKNSPLVRLGTKAGAEVVKVSVLGLYASLCATGLSKTLPLSCIIFCALTVPMGKFVLSFVDKNHQDKDKIFMAKYYCVRLHALFGLALAAGFVVGFFVLIGILILSSLYCSQCISGRLIISYESLNSWDACCFRLKIKKRGGLKHAFIRLRRLQIFVTVKKKQRDRNREESREMWVFYLISLPLTLGMVVLTLRYFAGPHVPNYVLITVAYAWFCSLSIIILVPADILTTLTHQYDGVIYFSWGWSYWSTFLLTWAVVPLIQGYEDAGDFTFKERLKTSIHENLVFYLVVGSIGLFGIILLATLGKIGDGGILGFAMGCSNTFGLVTGAFLLGFGLSEIPKGIWRNADWTTRQKVLSHKVAKLALKLDDAHQEFSNAIVVAQATSNQMSKRDPLRPYMNIIDQMLNQMLKEDPTFKPQGGRLGENDMDYDTDVKTMAALRRQLRIAREEYYRYRSEYANNIMEALELEDTVKNYDRRDATGWKYVSSFRPERKGSIGSALDTVEFIWRCILRKQLAIVVAILLGCMSAAVLLAEATILPSHFDLSLFSLIIKTARKQEVALQVAVLIPLVYMCVCTYYTLLKIGMMMFYALTPRQTSSVSLLMICSMVARYAPPISYNFLNLVSLENHAKTVFKQKMGDIDSAVPFFGKGFNKIYPLIMVIYTLLVAFNVFDRVINYFGNWKIFKFQSEADDTDGFDPSGMIILQKGVITIIFMLGRISCCTLSQTTCHMHLV